MKPTPFTIKYGKIVNELLTDVWISRPNNYPKESKIPKELQYTAVWDTGATCSVITNKVVEDSNLGPVGRSYAITPDSKGEVEVLEYLIDIILPNKLRIPRVRVIGFKELTDENDKIEVLIGMDIISKSDFAVTNKNDNTWLSFRIPSQGGIDYEKKVDD